MGESDGERADEAERLPAELRHHAFLADADAERNRPRGGGGRAVADVRVQMEADAAVPPAAGVRGGVSRLDLRGGDTGQFLGLRAVGTTAGRKTPEGMYICGE